MFRIKKSRLVVMVGVLLLAGNYFYGMPWDKPSSYSPVKMADGGKVLKGRPVLQSEPVLAKQSYLNYRKGANYLRAYEAVANVNSIILVEQDEKSISHATLYLLRKNAEHQWEERLKCSAHLGRNGIDKVREGDHKTPTGDYGITMAFGIKDKPDTQLDYLKVNDSMYCCGDKEFYNKIIDVRKVNHVCSSNSEHLIEYRPQYNYCLFLDYNSAGVVGKGSAIFLHCNGSYDYTLGCISVKEEDMLFIMKNIDEKVRICIYPYVGSKGEGSGVRAS